MHTFALVIVPAERDIERSVMETLAPFMIDEDRRPLDPNGLWDGWTIGGRYSGTFSGYDPWTDPALRIRCDICGGTGMRDDDIGRFRRVLDPEFTCNWCHGAGEVVSFTTEWPRHDGDIVASTWLVERLADAPRGWLPFAIFVYGSRKVVAREAWVDGEYRELLDDEGIRERLTEILRTRIACGLRDHAVIVDYHS